MSCIFIAFTLKNSSVAEFFVEMANTLSETREVVILTHATEKNHLKLNSKIEVKNWPDNKPNSLKGLSFLNKIVREYKPEAVIANFSTVNIMMLVTYVHGIKKRIAWYHTLSTQLEKKNLNRWRKRLFYGMSTKIICNSNAAKTDIVEVFKIDPKKVFVVYNAIREDFRKSTPQEKEQIIYAGRLYLIKGVDILIKAMPTILKSFPHLKLLIIGDDEGSGEYDKLNSLAENLEVKKNISFLGNCSKELVIEKFSESYCTVVPSRAESFGYVVIESFSVGTPVIGTKTTGISEIVRDGMDGFLFEKENHKQLANKILTLLENRELRKQFSENCRNRFLEKFEVKKVTSRFISEHL